MPIKINEVIIRAIISPEESAESSPSGGGEGADCGVKLSTNDKMELVQASVSEVMRILDQKRRA